jgi:hypothetical protein
MSEIARYIDKAVGDVFEVVSSTVFDEGSIIEYEGDEVYKLIEGSSRFNNSKEGKPGAISYESVLKPYVKGEGNMNNFTTEDYVRMQEASGLKVGYEVRITHKTPTRHQGWGNSWECSMDKYIGKTSTITSMDSDGVRLEGFSYGWPFQSLELANRTPVYKPMTITLETLEDFETMKAIMHLHNKVSGSSFFDLEWTPDSHEVKKFMKEKHEELDAHHAGWSKY